MSAAPGGCACLSHRCEGRRSNFSEVARCCVAATEFLPCQYAVALIANVITHTLGPLPTHRHPRALPLLPVRYSALETLFDTLKFDGNDFTPSFWLRIFDSVLLPIFDHVRAQVTDTTTFTSEKRIAQVRRAA